MKGKRTPIEIKAAIIEKKINTFASAQEIANELNIPERTASRVIGEELPIFLKENPEIADKYYKRIKAEGIKVTDILNIDQDLLNEYTSFIGDYKEVKNNLEGFMLQSIGKGYIRRKTIKSETRYSILEKYGFKCAACGSSPKPDNEIELHIDHILPYSLGGVSCESNYQVLCNKCNVSKGNSFIIKHNEDEMKKD